MVNVDLFMDWMLPSGNLSDITNWKITIERSREFSHEKTGTMGPWDGERDCMAVQPGEKL